MKHTAKRPTLSKGFSLKRLIWSRVWDKDEPLVLYEMGNKTPTIINKGDFVELPKQRQFIRACHEYDFVLYGGAMGGGKSYIGLWAVICFLFKCYLDKGLVNVRAGIFCETYPTLYDRQISNLGDYLPRGLGKWNDARKEFRLKARFGGGIICFRNLDKLDRYKSTQFAIIFVDEITENGNPKVYDILSTRLRWKGLSHCPFIAATNPGGPGHQWVYDLCINTESETYLRPRLSEKKNITTKGCFFIQCLPEENPYLDDNYYVKLERLPENLRKAYLEGDWTVFDGQFFNMFENGVHVLNRPKQLPKNWLRFRAMDLGRAHPFVCLWGAVSPNGTLFVYREYSSVGHAADWHKKRIAHLSRGEEYELTIFPHDMSRANASREGDHTPYEIFLSDENGGSFAPAVLGGKNRRERIDALVAALSFERETYVDKSGLLLQRITRRPRIRISPRCKKLISSIRAVVHDEKDPEVYKRTNATRPGHGDDEVSALDLLWSIAERTYIPEEVEEEEVYEDRDVEYASEEAGSCYSDF